MSTGPYGHPPSLPGNCPLARSWAACQSMPRRRIAATMAQACGRTLRNGAQKPSSGSRRWSSGHGSRPLPCGQCGGSRARRRREGVEIARRPMRALLAAARAGGKRASPRKLHPVYGLQQTQSSAAQRDLSGLLSPGMRPGPRTMRFTAGSMYCTRLSCPIQRASAWSRQVGCGVALVLGLLAGGLGAG